MDRILHELNDLVGLFLVIIAFGVSSCAKSLARIHAETECLHEDFNDVHQAHDSREAHGRAKYGI
jgi:hypothetical protein